MKKFALILLSMVCSMSAFTQAYSFISPESVRVCSGEGKYFVIEWEASEFNQTALDPSSYSLVLSETETEIVDIVDSVVKENSNKLNIYVNVSKAIPDQKSFVAKFILKQADSWLGTIDVEMLSSPLFELSMEPKEPQLNDEIKITAKLESGFSVDDCVFSWNGEKDSSEFTTLANTLGKNEITCLVTSTNGCFTKKTVEYTIYSDALLSPESAAIEVGSSTSFTLMRKGNDVTNEVSYWESSNTDVATVSDGTVFGVGVGTAEIYAYNGDSQILGEASVVVTEAKVYTLNIVEDTVISVGDEMQLKLNLNGVAYDGTGKVSWDVVSDNIVAEINSDNGILSAIGEGTCMVVAKIDDEVVAKVRVIIQKNTYEIVIEDSDGVFGIGETVKFQLLLNGKEDVTGKASWNIPQDLLEINVETGEITGLAEGSAYIFADIDGTTVASLDVIIEKVCNAGKIIFEACDYCYTREYYTKTPIPLQEGSVVSLLWSGESSEDGYISSVAIVGESVLYCLSEEEFYVSKGEPFVLKKNLKVTKTKQEGDSPKIFISFYSYGSDNEDVVFCLDQFSGTVIENQNEVSLSKPYRLEFNEETATDEYWVAMEAGDVCSVNVKDRKSGETVSADKVEYSYVSLNTKNVEYSETDNSVKALAVGYGGYLEVKYDGKVIGEVFFNVRKKAIQGETFTWNSNIDAGDQLQRGNEALELGSEYVFDIIDESGNDVTVVDWASYSSILSVEDGRVIARRVGSDNIRAVMSNDSIIECYFEVVANTDKWTYQKEYVVYSGEVTKIEVFNSNGDDVTNFLEFSPVDDNDWVGEINAEAGYVFEARSVGTVSYKMSYYDEDYEEHVVDTIKMTVKCPYKLVGEPVVQVNGEAITLSVADLDGEIQKLRNVYIEYPENPNLQIDYELSKGRKSVQIRATGYSSFEGEIYFGIENEYGDEIEYYDTIRAVYDGVVYSFSEDNMFLVVNESKDIVVYGDEKPVEKLPEGWHFDYDTTVLKIENGKIVSNAIGTTNVDLLSEKDEMVTSCSVITINEDGYCIIGLEERLYIEEWRSSYMDLVKVDVQDPMNPAFIMGTFVSSDPTIVKIEEKYASAIAPGKATIYAVVDKDTVASKDVTTSKVYHLGVGLTLDSEPVSIASLIDADEICHLPADAKWTSDYEAWEKVCSVKDGKIYPNSYGLTSFYDPEEQFFISVSVGPVAEYAVGITDGGEGMPLHSITLTLENSGRLLAESKLMAFKMADSEMVPVYPQFVASREGVVDLYNEEDDWGYCYPKQMGKTIIYAVLDKDTIGWVDVTVVPDMEYSFALDQTSYEMYEGESVQACITIAGLDKDMFAPEFDYDEQMLELGDVDGSEGLCKTITGLEPGTTDFTVTAYNGLCSATASVTVKPIEYDIVGNSSVEVGETAQYSLTANNQEYGNGVTWTIEETEIAYIDGYGLFSARATTGSVDIYAVIDDDTVATKTVEIGEFTGEFSVLSYPKVCESAEGTVSIECSKAYNKEYIAVLSGDGQPISVDFDDATATIDYANLLSGSYNIVYAGQTVGSFDYAIIEAPEVEIIPTVEDGNYLINTEYEFKAAIKERAIKGDAVVYGWNVVDENNPESYNNVSFRYDDSLIYVTFLNEGDYTIKSNVYYEECSEENSGIGYAQVSVTKPVSYRFEEGQFEMTVGDVKEMVLYANDDVYYGNVEWKVEDYEGMIIAEMDEYGFLHANYDGVTTVYAIIDTVVAKATVTINPSGTSKSLGFTEPGYSVAVNGTNEMCLEMYGFKSGYEISYEISNPNAVACEFSYNTNCFVAKGLTEGRAMLYVTLMDGEDKYTASAAISILAEEKPVVHFDQDVYQISVGEEVTAQLVFEEEIILPDGDQMKVSVENGTYAEISKSGNYFVTVKGMQEGETMVSASLLDGKYTAQAKIVVSKNTTEPKQMESPLYKTDNYICYSMQSVSMDMFAAPTVDYGKLQWYTADGKALENTPVINGTQVGSILYYVSQVATDASIDVLESEKVPVSVVIEYVAEPTLNIYDQKICNGKETEAFVAKSQYQVQWKNATGEPISNELVFKPQESGEYIVFAFNENTGCASAPVSTTVTFGTPVVPEIEGLQDSYSKGEPINLATSVDETLYDVVWDVDGSIYQGQDLTISYPEVGEYAIICKTIEKETSCVETAEVTVVVSETIIPVKAISVAPQVLNMFVGEKDVIAVAFEPSFATNKNYTIKVEDEEIANVSGSTVYGLGKGTTKAIITSSDNKDAVAEIIINVDSLIQAREISMPNIITMAVGEETMVQATVLPNNSTNKTVLFREKSDTSVVKITPEGKLTAKAEGTTTIVAYVGESLIATAVVYVTSEIAEIESIQLPEKIEMKVGDSLAVPVKVTPTTLAIRDLNWLVGDEEIVVFDNGVVKAQAVGTTKLAVSYKDVTAEVSIEVSASSAPVVVDVQEKTVATDGKVEIDLSKYVTDDNTDFKDLNITSNSEHMNVDIVEGVATISPKSPEYVGKDNVEFTITDKDGMSSKILVPVEIKEIENLAPVIKLHNTSIAENISIKFINLSDIAEDDLLDWSDLKFEFDNLSEVLNVKCMNKRQLRLIKVTEFTEAKIVVTVSDGVNTTQDTLYVYSGSIPNKAPEISAIPVQNETDDVKFGTIQLADYVADDYTTPSAITWKAAMSENLAISIVDGVASVKVLNEFWKGAESVMFYAADEQGLTDSIAVYFVRDVTIKTEQEENIEAVWEGAPIFDIISMRSIGTPGQQFVLMANISGFNGSFAWTIDGANGIEEGSLMQMVTFDEPGEYDVTFTIMSDEGQVKSLTKEKMLTVIGIDNRQPQICKGQSVTLNATEGLDSYYWTSNDVKSSATVRPDATMTYAVIMKKGLFTFTDSVSVKVSVPVTLMEDSVMCAGTTFELAAQGEYESYSWNTGSTTSSIMIPDQVATYTVFTVDDMNCASIDTFNLTKVNPLPVLNIAEGANLNPCDGEMVTLNAGSGYVEYNWLIGKGGKVQSLLNVASVTVDTTSNVGVMVIDENGCYGHDTTNVVFKYPYAEQIGVATFSETSDHVILAWGKTLDVNTVSYRIERETGVTDNWEIVGDAVSFTEPGLVVDEDVNYKERAFKYRLVTTDGCGNEAVSAVHRTMGLSVLQQYGTGEVSLHWTAYEPMENVTQYLILRGMDAAHLDTIAEVPASNLYEIWNETEEQPEKMLYKVVFRLKDIVDENKYKTLVSVGMPNEEDEQILKAESGPFSLAMSNIAEAENEESVNNIVFPADVIVYPTQVSSVINVAIVAANEENFTVELVNAKGQIITTLETGMISKTLLQIPAEGLTQGIYGVKVSTDNQTKTIQVVK